MIPTIKLLAIIEATTVTGPAKNLLNFCRLAREPHALGRDLPRVEVSIATFHRGASLRADEAPNQFVAAAREAGVPVEVIGERFRFDPGTIGTLRRAVERITPDIIQTHMIKSHFLVRLAGLNRARPWVAFHHGYTTTDRKMRVYNYLNRWSLPHAARVVTVCEPFAEMLAREEGVERSRIVVRHNSVAAPTPVSEDERSAVRERLGIGASMRMVLAVGRLSEEKGHVHLIRSLAIMWRLAPVLDFRLVVLGEGPERERVEAEAQANGLADQVVFAGHAKDVRPFYAAADVLALPSHSEGSPNVLLEAMAAGLPAVATRVGGVPEIAEDGETALVVPPRDEEAFGAALARLLTDEELGRRLAEAARVSVLARFSPEAYARALGLIYCELLPDRFSPTTELPVGV